MSTLNLFLHKGVSDPGHTPAPTPTGSQTHSQLTCNMTAGIMQFINSKWVDLMNRMQSDYANAVAFADMIDDLIALIPVLGQDVKNIVDFGAAVYGANILSIKADYNTAAQAIVECYLYCLLLAMPTPDVTSDVIASWTHDISVDGTLANDIKIPLFSLILGIGLAELRKKAFIYANQTAVCDCADCAPITITYPARGSGPTTVHVGDEITFTTAFSTTWYVRAHFSQCVKLTVINVDGWTPYPGGDGTEIGKFCDGSSMERQDALGSPLNWNAATCVSEFAADSNTPFSPRIRIDAVC